LAILGVNLSGKHPTGPTYHTSGHFQTKNKNGYEVAIHINISKICAQIEKALLKNSNKTKQLNIYGSTVNQILELVS